MKKQIKQIIDDGYIVITKEPKKVTLVTQPHIVIDVTLNDLMCLYKNALAKKLEWRGKGMDEVTSNFVHLTKDISFFVTWPKRNTKNKKRGRK